MFRRNLLPQRNKWIEYGEREKDSSRTERALLRHTLNHLLCLLDDGSEKCFPEEVYIHPPMNPQLSTGSIVKCRTSETYFVVMNPACDLVVRDDGKFKTNRILVGEIESQASLFPVPPAGALSNNKMGDLKRAYQNKWTNYHHWLPKTDFFEGGFINFRKIKSFTQDDFNEKFKESESQISPSFVKDIVSRFSSYYARQGQPDIDVQAPSEEKTSS